MKNNQTSILKPKMTHLHKRAFNSFHTRASVANKYWHQNLITNLFTKKMTSEKLESIAKM